MQNYGLKTMFIYFLTVSMGLKSSCVLAKLPRTATKVSGEGYNLTRMLNWGRILFQDDSGCTQFILHFRTEDFTFFQTVG